MMQSISSSDSHVLQFHNMFPLEIVVTSNICTYHGGHEKEWRMMETRKTWGRGCCVSAPSLWLDPIVTPLVFCQRSGTGQRGPGSASWVSLVHPPGWTVTLVCDDHKLLTWHLVVNNWTSNNTNIKHKRNKPNTKRNYWSATLLSSSKVITNKNDK